MRVRVQSLHLEGTDRHVHLAAGLNVITGPIATGKTTVVRLIKYLLGGSAGSVPAEVRRSISTVSGTVLIGSQTFTIRRPVVTTRTAITEIAGDSEVYRLPGTQGAGGKTYVRWLLERLNLPRLEVPSAPSRPDSEPSPVSISDYLLYCYLPQEDLGYSLFGHRDTHKNIKRKYVFEIIYGIYGVEAAEVQDELRDVQTQLRTLRNQQALFTDLLEDTELANRAHLERERATAQEDLRNLESLAENIGATARETPVVQELRDRVLALEANMAALSSELEKEHRSIRTLEELAGQYELQVGRSVRSLSAQRHLSDIDFVVCPRCGADVESERSQPEICYLCLQTPGKEYSRETIVAEQGRLEAQLVETTDLVRVRREREKALRQQYQKRLRELEAVRAELDFQTRSFVSSRASEIADVASRRAGVRARISQIDEYLRVLQKLEEAQQRTQQLDIRRLGLEERLEELSTASSQARDRIGILNGHFNRILERFSPPAFGEQTHSDIEEGTYLPTFHGRRFDDLSSPGLATLVTLAYALAHHETALELDLMLPNILIVDGLSEHWGEEGLDPQRGQSVYDYLVDLCSRCGERLQVIVVDNDVRPSARPFVRLELSEQDRLVPDESAEDE